MEEAGIRKGLTEWKALSGADEYYTIYMPEKQSPQGHNV